jgi:hypothetical protein
LSGKLFYLSDFVLLVFSSFQWLQATDSPAFAHNDSISNQWWRDRPFQFRYPGHCWQQRRYTLQGLRLFAVFSYRYSNSPTFTPFGPKG